MRRDAGQDFATDRLPAEIVARMERLLKRLEHWPEVSGAKALSGPLAGHWRLRRGDYRLQFRVEQETVIAELARRAGVRVETISRLEHAKHSPNAATMDKIVQALQKAAAPGQLLRFERSLQNCEKTPDRLLDVAAGPHSIAPLSAATPSP